jgi:polyribonucleotide nucleotidyltransferase
MDIKIEGLTRSILESALDQAKDGRLHIIGKMLETLPAVRPALSAHAPRITTNKVRPDQIRGVFGSGGKTIKGITEQTGCSINIDDDGTIAIASPIAEAVEKAIKIIESLLEEPEVGKTYHGTVKRVVDFGAFVEILPGTEALLHVSEIAYERTERVSDLINEGDEIDVKVLSVERDGKIRLSRKALLPVPEGYVAPPAGDRGPRGPRRDGGGGGGGRVGGRGRRDDRGGGRSRNEGGGGAAGGGERRREGRPPRERPE